jgi:hypothetical protein
MINQNQILKKFLEKQRQDISTQGYKDNSPYKNNPFNVIEGDSNGTPITMKGVSQTLRGIDEFGNEQIMYPGEEYLFPGASVTEIPIAQKGGKATRQDSLNLYNRSRQVENWYIKNNYTKDNRNSDYVGSKLENNDFYYNTYQGEGVDTNAGFFGANKISKKDYRKVIDKNRYYQRETADAKINAKSPMQMYDKRIEPTKERRYMKDDDYVSISSYNSIANKPFDLLTEKEKAQRVKQYGRQGVPNSYNPGVKSKPNNTTPNIVRKPNTTTGKQVKENKNNGMVLNQTFQKKPQQQKNTYADSLALYNKGLKNKNTLKNFSTSKFLSKEELPDLKQADPEVYKDYKRTGILPTEVYTDNGKFEYGYKKPTGTKPPVKQNIEPKINIPRAETLPFISNNEVKSNLDFTTSPIVQRTQGKYPKYWNVVDKNNQRFGGYEQSYQISDPDELRELPKELWTRKVTPKYESGGEFSPIELAMYIKQQADAHVLPQAQRGAIVQRDALNNIQGQFANNLDRELRNNKMIINQKDLRIKKYATQNKVSLEKAKKEITQIDNTLRYSKNNQVRKEEPQNIISRGWDIISNPMTSLSYVSKGQDIPKNLGRGVESGYAERNIMDMPMDILNPAFYANQAYNLGDNSVSTVSNLSQGNYPAAFRDVKNAGLNAVSLIPAVTELAPVVSKTYKINPYAEKLNNPEKSYRIAGMNSYNDFLQTGVVRSQRILPENASIMDRINNRTTSFPSFQKGYADPRYLSKGKNVIYETDLPTFARGDINPVTGVQIRSSHYAHRPIDLTTGNVMTEIPASNIKVYDSNPHWLKGYREMNPNPSPNSSFINNIISRTERVPQRIVYDLEHDVHPSSFLAKPKPTLLETVKKKATDFNFRAGELFYDTKKATGFDEVLIEANKKLKQGLGVKKGDFNLELESDKFAKGFVNVKIDGRETGNLQITGLQRAPKSFTDLITGKGRNNLVKINDVKKNQFMKAQHPGFAKEGDYPFASLTEEEKVFFQGKGISGEINKSISESLKERQMRLYSGATGHTDEGAARYFNLHNKGKVEDITPRGMSDRIYMYKKNGGLIF